MVGLETGEVLLLVWVWLTLDAPKGAPCWRCLGDCCLGNWARIWAGEPTRVLGEGSLAEATFSPAAEAPRKANNDEVSTFSNLGGAWEVRIIHVKDAVWRNTVRRERTDCFRIQCPCQASTLRTTEFPPVFCLWNEEDPQNLLVLLFLICSLKAEQKTFVKCFKICSWVWEKPFINLFAHGSKNPCFPWLALHCNLEFYFSQPYFTLF